MKLVTIVAAALAAGSAAHAANIYMLTSGQAPTDAAAVAALTSRGHTVTVGVDYLGFNGTVNLAPYDTVYLQCNANWQAGIMMPVAGQQQLIDWVNAGGRLVTSEWVVYYTYSGGKFETLAAVIPVNQSFDFGLLATATYSQVTPDPVINAGVPALFSMPLTSYAGSETYSTAKAGAITYYDTGNQFGAPGLVGWTVGGGSVYSFMSTCGLAQVANPDFGRLFANVMGDVASCYADCNGDSALTIADFGCFQGKFVGGDPYADCNASGNLTIADFACFQAAFSSGCP